MKTKIEWTEYRWNPTTGCTKISRGCSNCYAAFGSYLIPLLRRIHGSAIHTGKLPAGKFPSGVVKTEPLKKVQIKTRAKSTLSDLKDELQEAIRLENFEQAAKLRDKIRELEKKGLDQTARGY